MRRDVGGLLQPFAGKDVQKDFLARVQCLEWMTMDGWIDGWMD